MKTFSAAVLGASMHNVISDPAKRFLVGIPVWAVTALLLDGLNRACSSFAWSDGAGMSAARPVLMSPASHFIFGYFVFSFIAAVMTKTRRWRFRLAVPAHLLLVASIVAVVLPDYLMGGSSPGVVPSEAVVLTLLYAVFFIPWFIAWVKLLLGGTESAAQNLEGQRSATNITNE